MITIDMYNNINVIYVLFEQLKNIPFIFFYPIFVRGKPWKEKTACHKIYPETF